MKTKNVVGMLLSIGFLASACASAPVSNPPLEQEQLFTQISETPAGLIPESVAEEGTLPALLPEESPPSGAAMEFSTDFSRHTVPYSEILSGGPLKDGIPAIDEPVYVEVDEAKTWLKPAEPVVLVKVGEEARAYPVQILMWHEIVNDTVGDLPLTVTFCPLCNTAIAFIREFDDQVLDFGTTGRLRYSNLIMYDRQTETWWQQANGEAIAGEYAGSRLEFYPAVIISWQDFMTAHPDGTVLSQETGYNRPYGQNPYTGYDDLNNHPFLFDGPQTPGVLPPVARVLTIDLNNEAVAYPYETLAKVNVVNDVVGGQPVVVFWAAGTASALDTSLVASGRDVGSAAAYSRVVERQELSFQVIDGKITDQQTGSEWNVLGQAIKGELAGYELSPVVAINHFWFSWAAFKPETRIYQPISP